MIDREADAATIYPAIDLRSGRCVRLEQGEGTRETVYGEDPLAVARRFVADGARWIHVVDLDAAFGEGDNRRLIRELAAAVDVCVQTGGGLRDMENLEAVLEEGAARAVIGTAALENPALLREAVRRWGADRIAVGLDGHGRELAVRGWRVDAGVDLMETATGLADMGIGTVIHTDIRRDGMLTGPNLALSQELARTSGLRVIVSGGVASLDDIRAVAAAAREDAGIAGVIAGKALYEGRFGVSEALAALG